MTYKDLVDRLANEANINRSKADHTIKSLSGVIVSALKEGQKVTIPEFGTFKSEFKPEKTVKSPQGKDVTVPNRLRPKFKFSSTVINSMREG